MQAQEQAGNDQPVADQRPDPREIDDLGAQDPDSGLVETPEEKPQQRARKPRAPRKPRPDNRDGAATTPEAAE
jgi:hypothetical protein